MREIKEKNMGNKIDIQEVLQKWKRHCPDEMNYCYHNPFTKLLFDLGHKYIASRSRDITGVTLDLGCGTGYHLTFEDVSAKKEYYCLDSNPEMLNKILDSRVKKITARCEKIPLNSKTVDLIIASHILEHVSNLEECLTEMKRILTDRGTVLVVLPCDPGWLWRALSKVSPNQWRLRNLGIDYDVVMKHEHVQPFSYCLEKLSQNFQVQEIIYYPFLVKNYNSNLLCGLTLRQRRG